MFKTFIAVAVLVLAGCAQSRRGVARPSSALSFEERCEQRAAMGEEPPECADALARTTAKRRASAAQDERRRAEAAEKESSIKEFEKTRPRAGCLLRLRNRYNECMQSVAFLRVGNNPLLAQKANALEIECARAFQVDAIVCNGLPETAQPSPSPSGRIENSTDAKINDGDK